MAKVIILGSAYPLRAGGLATFNERLAQEFVDQGHEVIVYTFSLEYPSALFPGKTQYAIRPAPKDLDIRVKVNSISPINWLKVGYELKREKADLLVVRYWMPFMAPCLGTIASITRKNRKTKVITLVDGLFTDNRGGLAKMVTRYYVNKSDGFITLSKPVLEELKTFDKYNKPKVYSPHPLYDNFGVIIDREQALAQLKLSPDYRYILFFGFIKDYKGLDILLESLTNPILDELPVKLIVAGEFSGSNEKYMKIIREKGLGSKVVLHTRFIPSEMVSVYFCASDLVVQPYKDAAQSGVTQIAYHFNVPMVVTNVGSLPDMVPHMVSGIVVDPDPKNVANAIHRFFTKNLSEQLVKGIEKQKKRFSWNTLTDCIFSLAKIK